MAETLPGTEVVKRSPMQEVLSQVRSDTFLSQVATALPGNVTPERFVRVTVTAIQQTPDLITADRNSLFRSVIRCAQDGLLPDGREAALVKFGSDATYMPMIGGLRKIAAKHGLSLTAYVVYENDEFDYELGADASVHHKPPKLNEDRGEPIGAYAVATDKHTGEKYLDVMSRGEIERIRQESRGKSAGPWTKHWGEMARKTVGRRLFKQLPLGDLDEVSSRIVEQADVDVEHDNGEVMSVEEANVNAALATQPPPSEPLDDTIEDAVIVDEGQGELSFAMQAEQAQRGRAAKGTT